MIEIEHLHSELRQTYQQCDWPAFHRALSVLVRVGDKQGQDELSRHALALIDLVGTNGNGRHQPGDRVEQLFESLMSHFSTVRWQKRSGL